MLASFRNLSKSKVGTSILIGFLVLVVASFAMSDLSRFQTSGPLTGGWLAKAGGERIDAREFDDLAQRALATARQQNPEATMANIGGELPMLFDQLLNERALTAFAHDNGLFLSKRLIDAQLAQLPGTKGLDGKFSEQAYAQFLSQQRLTDAQLRGLIGADIMQRLVLVPAAANASIPVGVATPYASLLLEQRNGKMAIISTDRFTAGLTPTAGDLQAFYDQNKNRYMLPEQRVLRMAAYGPEQIAKVVPSDAEIAAYYKANAAQFAGKQTRVISQAVVADQNSAAAIAQRARGGATFAAAAAPAGLSAADISVGPQTRDQFAALAGNEVASAAFAAQKGGIVGPIRSDLGWHVIRIDDIRDEAGTSLAEARPAIVTALTENKRKEVIADLIGKVEDAIADGSSFSEAAAVAGLATVETPPITAAGQAMGNPSYKLPPQLSTGLKSGFDLGADEDPVVEALPNDSGFVLVGVGRVISSAPAPLANIRDRVTGDWIQKKANDRARAVAQQLANKVAKGMDFAQAVSEAGPGVAGQPISARRIQLSQLPPDAATPMKILFSLSAGKSRLAADPQGRGFFVVKNDRIIPGNALTQPALITQTQRAFTESMGQELAAQFMTAVKADVGVKRNEKAITETRARLVGSASAE